MYPTGIEQPFNPVFQPGHHENLSDLDAGDWVPSSDATMSDRFPSSGQKTLCREAQGCARAAIGQDVPVPRSTGMCESGQVIAARCSEGV